MPSIAALISQKLKLDIRCIALKRSVRDPYGRRVVVDLLLRGEATLRQGGISLEVGLVVGEAARSTTSRLGCLPIFCPLPLARLITSVEWLPKAIIQRLIEVWLLSSNVACQPRHSSKFGFS